jgi:gamma-glutamyltranspeptidase / glutathione hydrolase
MRRKLTILKNGKLFLVLGSSGSSRIITRVTEILPDAVDYGMNIQLAVDALRFQPQWLPDAGRPEKGISAATVHVLDKMGHTVQTRRVGAMASAWPLLPRPASAWARATSGTKERR